MTSESLSAEITKEPFRPFRLHLASGKTVDVPHANVAWLQQNTVLILHPLDLGSHQIGKYEVIALRLIERIEQLDEAQAK
jgi:hypothetical protein